MKFTRTLLSVVAATGLVVGVAGVAAADNVQNDVTVGEVVTFAAGGSTVVSYSVHATANDPGDTTGRDSQTCNPERESLTLTIAAPADVDVDADGEGGDSLVFETCGEPKSVTFTSDKPGEYEITVTANPSSGYNTNPAKFDLIVTEPLSPIDETPPITNVTGFAPGDVFIVGVDALPVPGCSSVDESGGSGLALEATPSSGGGPLGEITVTCSGAVDNAGNEALDAVSKYYVRYGHDGGIGQPINPDGSSQFSQKRAVPVKFSLLGDAPAGFDVSTFVLYRTKVACPGDASFTAEDSSGLPVTASTTWRYDADSDQYIYNASLAGTTVNACYQYQVALGDGGNRVVSATFKVTK